MGLNIGITNSGKLVQRSTRLYLSLFQPVSIPTSIATTGISSDTHYEHASTRGEISKNIPPLQSDLIGPFYVPM